MAKEIDYSGLPRPPRLKRAGIIEFISGREKFGFRCTAATLRKGKCSDGRIIDWLHFEGSQVYPAEQMANAADPVSCLVPAGYVTSIKPDPDFRIEPGKNSPEIVSPGILNPIHADPSGALGVEVVDREINNLMSSGAID
jgi:hypothetical protein